MDSGITEQVDSITQEDPFIGVSQKIKLFMRSSWISSKAHRFGLGQVEFKVLWDFQVKMLC